jgi:hypothetical protein
MSIPSETQAILSPSSSFQISSSVSICLSCVKQGKHAAIKSANKKVLFLIAILTEKLLFLLKIDNELIE